MICSGGEYQRNRESETIYYRERNRLILSLSTTEKRFFLRKKYLTVSIISVYQNMTDLLQEKKCFQEYQIGKSFPFLKIFKNCKKKSQFYWINFRELKIIAKFRDINFREWAILNFSRDKLSRKGVKFAKFAKVSLAKVSPNKVVSVSVMNAMHFCVTRSAYLILFAIYLEKYEFQTIFRLKFIKMWI